MQVLPACVLLLTQTLNRSIGSVFLYIRVNFSWCFWGTRQIRSEIGGPDVVFELQDQERTKMGTSFDHCLIHAL